MPKAGRWWDKNTEIDHLGFNHKEKAIFSENVNTLPPKPSSGHSENIIRGRVPGGRRYQRLRKAAAREGGE
ncbi:DUF234 domain-containing protein [Desulfofundulus sp. TPOSR]|uniref:DUF234 domain-containing protein n=1 Tax=Desulfofundulus sp. TPOSR TaxID=2714340 RepID=UPI0037C18BF2